MAFDLKQTFKSMRPGTKQKFMLACFVGAGMSLAAFTHFIGNKESSAVAVKAVAPQQISIDNKLLEKTMTTETASNKQEIETLRKQLEEYTKKGAAQPAVPGATGLPATPPPAAPAQADPQTSTPKSTGGKSSNNSVPAVPKQASPLKIPPPPPMNGMTGSVGRTGMPDSAASGMSAAAGRPIETQIGDIEMMTISKSGGKETAAVSDKDKKKVESLYLPTGSFMEATSLNGLYAPTTSGARGNPVPILIRVKTPSRLPNEVKANLKGCFVVAEGVGNLSDERAHLRLVNLSCISKNGEAVIDQKIKGYVVDDDGYIGLKGRVVSRLGSTIARSLVSGFFGGFGEALKGSTQRTSVSALGLPTSNPVTGLDQMAIAGAGQGLSDATKQIQQFYLELAKQTVPVIEIPPRKKITMIISEGAKLDVKPLHIVK